METVLNLLGEHWLTLLQLILGAVLALGWVKAYRLRQFADILRRALGIITEAIEATDRNAIEEVEVGSGLLQDALQAIDGIKERVETASSGDPDAGLEIDDVLDEQGYLGQHK